MMWRVSLLVNECTDSQIYKLTISTHFDQFNAVQKETIPFLYNPPHFQPCLTMHTFKRKILISFFQIYWYIIVNQIHTYQILQTDLVSLRMLRWFKKKNKLLASCIRCFIKCITFNFCKIEHTVGCHDILQKCISDVHASRGMGPQPE